MVARRDARALSHRLRRQAHIPLCHLKFLVFAFELVHFRLEKAARRLAQRRPGQCAQARNGNRSPQRTSDERKRPLRQALQRARERKSAARKKLRRAANPFFDLAKQPAQEMVQLEPARNALLLFCLCVAGGLACVALASWLGWGVIRSLGRGGFDLLPALYAGASLIGVQQAVVRGRRFLRDSRNPSPKLGLRPAMLTPGQKFNVAWIWKGGARSARPFRLWLEGHEAAYVLKLNFTPHGEMKEEKLEKVRFAARLLAELPAQPSGTREFELPGGVIPSFEGVRARIEWQLRVEVITRRGTSNHQHAILIRTPAT